MLRFGLGEQGLLTPLVCQWRTTELLIPLSLINFSILKLHSIVASKDQHLSCLDIVLLPPLCI